MIEQIYNVYVCTLRRTNILPILKKKDHGKEVKNGVIVIFQITNLKCKKNIINDFFQLIMQKHNI